MEKAGKVYLVGAGPGDPGLITLKGWKLLQSCDVVIYDRLVSDRLLDYVKEGCELINVGKTVGNHSFRQEDINRILIEKALRNPVVVRLKGGDPFVFGRGGEEVLALKEHGIAFEVIPGVTSAIAAATYAGIPITHRGSSQSFTVVTGHTAGEDDGIPAELRNLAKTEGTLVILMGIGNLDQIRDELLAGGMLPDTPAAVIANGTTRNQREVRGILEDISRKVKEAEITAPTVIILGKVAELDMRATICYPLSGVRVGITGTGEIRHKLANRLEELGADAITVGTMEIAENSDHTQLDAALMNLDRYHWLTFTSSNAVNLFFQRLSKLNIDHRRLSHLRFAVVGSGTAKALRQYGYQADLVPQQYTVAGLAKELIGVVKSGEIILIPRAKQGSEVLTKELDRNKLQYEDIKIYDVINGRQNKQLSGEQLNQLDYLTFASSSGVRGFFSNKKITPAGLSAHTKIVCIGEVTQKTLSEYGIEKVLIAGEASAEGITECILKDNLKRSLQN